MFDKELELKILIKIPPYIEEPFKPFRDRYKKSGPTLQIDR